MAKVKDDRIQKTTFLLMLILFLSRFIGFIREMIFTRVYGAGAETDAFFAAFAVPDLMYDLLVTGALSSGFMPVFASYLTNDDEEGAWKAASTFITVSMLCIIIFNILGIAFAKYLVPLVAMGMKNDPYRFDLTVKLTRVMFTGVSFTVLAGLSKGILESYKKFTAPAYGPVVYNLGIILGAILLGKLFGLGIYGVAIGVVIGAFGNFFVQFPHLSKVGKRFRLSFDTSNSGYKKMLFLMIPAMVGLGVNRIKLVINQNAASYLATGSISVLRLAQRVMVLPVGIFGGAVLTTIFPLMNQYFAQNDMEEYKNTLGLGLRTMFFLTIPCAVGLLVLNVPIVRLLFKTGAFTESDVLLTSAALGYYSIGVISNSAVPIMIRGFYSIQKTAIPLYVGIIATTISGILNFVFIKFNAGIAGIALTSSLVTMVEVVILYNLLSIRLRGLRTRELLMCIIKATIAAFVMGGVAFISSKFIESKIGYMSKLAQLANIGITLSLSIGIYFAIAYILRMPELEFVTGIINRKRKKR